MLAGWFFHWVAFFLFPVSLFLLIEFLIIDLECRLVTLLAGTVLGAALLLLMQRERKLFKGESTIPVRITVDCAINLLYGLTLAYAGMHYTAYIVLRLRYALTGTTVCTCRII